MPDAGMPLPAALDDADAQLWFYIVQGLAKGAMKNSE
jgi:hypothetical protein